MKQPPVTWFFLVFILLSLATSIIAQEVEDESEYSYVPGSANGPENWGNLKEEWAKCKTGQNQSPINLRQLQVEEIPRSQDVIKFYRPSPTILKNRGQDIALEWHDEMNKIRMNCTDYILRNFHWHSPSEHTINGIRFALELHMVHQSAENKTAVIGLAYKIGTPDPFLSKLAEKIEQISDSRREVDAGIIDPIDIKMRGDMYYKYIGSLTTPPCTEGVIWTVNQQVGTVSIEQVTLLMKALDNDAMGNNVRPLQPINGRKVHLYLTRKCFGETL